MHIPVPLDNLVCEGKKRFGMQIEGINMWVEISVKQWYLKCGRVMTSFYFIGNVVDQYIYLKINLIKYIFLALDVDINFEMKEWVKQVLYSE